MYNYLDTGLVTGESRLEFRNFQETSLISEEPLLLAWVAPSSLSSGYGVLTSRIKQW
jgi:hypothetical protein